MIAMSISLLFIWWQGSLEEVGVFSGITAIVTPIISFSHYRYVEYLSTSKNKHLALSTTISSSLSTYIVIVIIIAPVYIYIYGSFFTVLLMCVYKCFEMLTDIYIAYLSITKNNLVIKKIVFTRLICIFIGFSCLVVLSFNYNIDILFCVALLLSMIFAFLFIFDFRKVGFIYDRKKTLKYVHNNVSYGLSSLTISINSLLPRYFFIYTGDNNTLGIYSIVYLFSANLVTLIQYPISIYASHFNNLVSKNNFLLIVVSLVVAFIISPSLYFFESYDYFFYIFSMILIFVSLILRAILITSVVFLDLNLKVVKILLISLTISFIIIFAINSVTLDSFKLEDGIYYTILSSCVTVLLSYYYRSTYKY